MAYVASDGAEARAGTNPAVDSGPPDPGGYFDTQPVGSWSTLPDDDACRSRVHQSTWEPRPENTVPNRWMPSTERIHDAFAARPVAIGGSYDKRWDSWLLQRVTGHDTGTTDEIIQWAACKWGISDNVLRAVAVRESTWYQDLVYDSSGRCVPTYGCGDEITQPSSETVTFCAAISRYGSHFTDSPGECPRTFGITGVMSWEDPSWGQMPDNQNGTFPFNRRSTAFALDYLGAQLRGCYEGWEWWLDNTGAGGYRSGDLWGCVGAWYSGDWHSANADGYVERVRTALDDRVWLSETWASQLPPCRPDDGCPRGVLYSEQ